MRKVICAMLMLALVLSAVGVSYAATPRFVSIDNYTTSFSISNEGKATYTVSSVPKPSMITDKITATVKIVNSSGYSVYTRTQTLAYSSIGEIFTGSGNYQLTANGRYELQVTFKCYDGTTLLETIPANVRYASW